MNLLLVPTARSSPSNAGRVVLMAGCVGPAVERTLALARTPASVQARCSEGRDGEHRAPAAAVRAGYGRGGRHVVHARQGRKRARHRGGVL